MFSEATAPHRGLSAGAAGLGAAKREPLEAGLCLGFRRREPVTVRHSVTSSNVHIVSSQERIDTL